MSNFNRAFDQLLSIEGSYANDPADSGGETVCGIARKHWPAWEGWAIVDWLKAKSGFPGNLSSSLDLQGFVHSFYKREFWDKFNLDDVSYSLGHEIFEQSVNLGISRTSRHLQEVLNALNYNQQWGVDLKVDGKFGPASRSRLDLALKAGRFKAVQYGINGLQCAYYIELANSRPSQRKFTNGWLSQRGEASA